jgi:hypothetical protein
MNIAIVLAGLVMLVSVLPVDARVTRVEVTRREPLAGGQPFGPTGPYEKVVGRFHGELDPGHALNRDIVDLDRAPRNARGAVEYSADFYILRPVDLARGASGDLCPLDGAFIPFAPTKAEREAKGDPRLSLEERYGDRTQYVTRVREAALALQRSGYLLAEDVDRIVDQAARVSW